MLDASTFSNYEGVREEIQCYLADHNGRGRLHEGRAQHRNMQCRSQKMERPPSS